MRETTWTPAAIMVGDRADGLHCLVLADPLEVTQVPLGRSDAHRIGAELVKAAALTPEEIAELEQPLREDLLQ